MNNQDFYEFFHFHILKALNAMAINFNVDLQDSFKIFVVESPKDSSFGDISTNVAMVLSKSFSMNPMDFGNLIIGYINQNMDINKYIDDINCIKPGFINLKLNNLFWSSWLKDAVENIHTYGKLNIGNNKSVNIEYVSANPTGPMHIGHGRGAVIGDILANLYSFVGYGVHREYYVNDGGNQIITLGKSLYYRYMEQFNMEQTISKGDDFYPGEYLIDIAKLLIDDVGDRYVKNCTPQDLEFISNFAIGKILLTIKEDLQTIRVHHDEFISEKAVATDDAYNELLNVLNGKNLIYMGVLDAPKGKSSKDFVQREQKLFKSKVFGDDSDRALEKSDSTRTYFANDAIYHYFKIKRGYSKLINIWGADHIGYMKRMSSIVKALSDNSINLNIVAIQLVNLLNNGLPLKMSKRAGNFVTLKEVVDAVGVDAFRFMMIVRKNDVTLDFDFAKVKEHNNDNPVFYIQYAYARICSIINNANETFPNLDYTSCNLSLLVDNAEISLIKNILEFSHIIKNAIKNNDPHRLYLYLNDIAKNFHFLWNKGKENSDLRFIIKDNKDLTISRLVLLKFVQKIIRDIFMILSIDIKESM